MCIGGSAPKIEPAKPPAPPAPPPPVEDVKPLAPAIEDTAKDRRKKSGRNALRIDRTTNAPGASSGLNIPIN